VGPNVGPNVGPDRPDSAGGDCGFGCSDMGGLLLSGAWAAARPNVGPDRAA